MQRWLGQIREFFRSRTEIYNEADEGRQFNAIYLVMLVLSCLIALLGLLQNSPAVIIGAMLISPLMGPILSCGLALTMADWGLGRKALRNILLSIVETILIAVLATFLSPLKDATPEILARTNPNLMDLLIAFFSGAAGTLALCSRKGGLTILPGVAIATAVMPPLATAGYGLSTGQWVVARGAFMLFFTNLTAIIISADLVFLIVGFRPKRAIEEGEHAALVRGRFLIAGAVLLVLSVPLIRTLMRAAQQANLRRQVEEVLAEEISSSSERKLDRIALELQGRSLSVQAAVETPKFIPQQETQAWEVKLQARVGRPVRLELQQLQLAHQEEMPAAPNRDYLGGGIIRSAPPEPHLSVAGELQNVQDRIQSFLKDLLGPLNAKEITVRSAGAQPDATVSIEADAHVPAPISIDEWRVIAVAVSRELKAPVQFTGNLVLGDPLPLRFHPKSLRLVSTDRIALTQLLSQWNKRPDVSYRLVLPRSADPALTEKRVALLKRRSVKIIVAEDTTGTWGEDAMMFSAVQRLKANVQKQELVKTGPNP